MTPSSFALLQRPLHRFGWRGAGFGGLARNFTVCSHTYVGLLLLHSPAAPCLTPPPPPPSPLPPPSCLFPAATSYGSFNRVTNPHDFEVDGVHFLGTSGQNVGDLAKYSRQSSRWGGGAGGGVRGGGGGRAA